MKIEREWCFSIILQESNKFAASGMFQPYTEYSSDGLVYLLDKLPDDQKLLQVVWKLIDSIDDNDTIFNRFEKSFKSLIWHNHRDLAEKIIYMYLNDAENKRDDVDKFAHVCKLLPTDIEDINLNKTVTVYCTKYFGGFEDENSNRFMRNSDIRIEEFCAEYMLAMPQKRRSFIEDIWLATCIKRQSHYDRRESPIHTIFNHYCYIAITDNKDNFWQLWEIMFESYKKYNFKEVIPSLLLSFDGMRPDLLNNWEVMEGSNVHINKLLRILPPEGIPYLSRLICKVGFKWLLPDCLRHIDKEILRISARDRKSMMLWQDSVEDMYDDAKTRDLIRRDNTLRTAYVEVLNGLISNGSAIAYLIRDYYI